MAESKRATLARCKINNAPVTVVCNKQVELVVVNDQLVPDNKDVDAGVFSR
jgi:hypothetical protein